MSPEQYRDEKLSSLTNENMLFENFEKKIILFEFFKFRICNLYPNHF